MTEGFSNPINAGDDLVIPMFQSPNYVPGASGWAIFRDGSAEFNDVTIRGGTVEDGTSLYYSPAPAAGNLAESIAAAGGTDSFGDPYVAGHGSYGGGIAAGLAANTLTWYKLVAGSWVAQETMFWNSGDSRLYLTGPLRILTGASPALEVDQAALIGGLLTASAGAAVTGGLTADALAVTGALTATGGTPGAPTLVTTDVPRNASSLYVNNWAAAAAGTDLTYELMPDNTVQVSGRLVNSTAGGISGGSNITTAVPAAYRPARDEPLSASAHATASPFASTAGGFVLMRSTGIVEFFGTFATTSTLEVSGRYPLGF
jgi:hypothetical protein